MQHITLTTGDVRWSPREEVDDGLMGLLVDHLAAGLRGPAPIPGQPYVMRATATDDGILIASILAHAAVILTMIVVPAAVDPNTRVTQWTADIILPTPGPWCLVRFHDAITVVPSDDLAWFGDYERCLAWAWLESGTVQQARLH